MLPNKQSAPEWFNQKNVDVQKQMLKLWTKKSKKWILTGKARQKRLAFVFYQRGRLSLDVRFKPHGVMCKQNKLEGLIPDNRKHSSC